MILERWKQEGFPEVIEITEVMYMFELFLNLHRRGFVCLEILYTN